VLPFAFSCSFFHELFWVTLYFTVSLLHMLYATIVITIHYALLLSTNPKTNQILTL